MKTLEQQREEMPARCKRFPGRRLCIVAEDHHYSGIATFGYDLRRDAIMAQETGYYDQGLQCAANYKIIETWKDGEIVE